MRLREVYTCVDFTRISALCSLINDTHFPSVDTAACSCGTSATEKSKVSKNQPYSLNRRAHQREFLALAQA
jgi:hypothetical protein